MTGRLHQPLTERRIPEKPNKSNRQKSQIVMDVSKSPARVVTKTLSGVMGQHGQGESPKRRPNDHRPNHRYRLLSVRQ